MQLRFISSSEKQLTQLKDGCRVYLWSQFKVDYKDQISDYEDNLSFYKAFETLWKQHPILEMSSLQQISNYLSEQQISVEEILDFRRNYYESRKASLERYEAHKLIKLADSSESAF